MKEKTELIGSALKFVFSFSMKLQSDRYEFFRPCSSGTGRPRPEHQRSSEPINGCSWTPVKSIAFNLMSVRPTIVVKTVRPYRWAVPSSESEKLLAFHSPPKTVFDH